MTLSKNARRKLLRYGPIPKKIDRVLKVCPQHGELSSRFRRMRDSIERMFVNGQVSIGHSRIQTEEL